MVQVFFFSLSQISVKWVAVGFIVSVNSVDHYAYFNVSTKDHAKRLCPFGILLSYFKLTN